MRLLRLERTKEVGLRNVAELMNSYVIVCPFKCHTGLAVQGKSGRTATEFAAVLIVGTLVREVAMRCEREIDETLQNPDVSIARGAD